jgi:RNA polymerase sigma-70 factor (ECF subfamily)
VTEPLEQYRPLLRDVAYRITGSAADADEIVQETFVRALDRPPADTTRSVRPWLVRVAANLARDALRTRRRRGYEGPWLPSPVEVLPASDAGPDEVVERRDAVGWATLVALEALTPQQRTVLVLREVADLTADEVADLLGTGAPAVRAAHARARRAVAAATPREPADLDPATIAALTRLSAGIQSGDLATLRAALAADVTFVSDGAGEFLAARNVLHGPDRVAKFLLGVLRKSGPMQVVPARFNDRLGLWVVPERITRRRLAPRSVLLVILGEDGRIVGLHSVSATGKLGAVHG